MNRVNIQLEIDRIVLDGVTIKDPEVFKDIFATKLIRQLTQSKINFSEDRDLQRIRGPPMRYRPGSGLDGSQVAAAVCHALTE